MLILPKSVFLMIPRTGTTWARQALRNGGVRYKEHGPKHNSDLPQAGSCPRFVFTFIRDPFNWVRSRWVLGPWEDELTPFWTADVNEFAARVTADMVRMYFQRWTSKATFVGTQANLADDLVRALREAGEQFDEAALRATPQYNVTDWETGEIVFGPSRPGNPQRARLMPV